MLCSKSCTPSTDCSTPTPTSFQCNSNTCTIVCSSGTCMGYTITCNVGTTCHISCTGASTCNSANIYALHANDLTIIAGGATGNNQFGDTIITCPNNGPGGAPSCHIEGQGGTSFQFWKTIIRAVEGFNDVELSCPTSNCMFDAEMQCGSNYAATCLLDDSSPPTINSCKSSSSPSPINYCKNVQLTPSPTTYPTSTPTTFAPTTSMPTTNMPSTTFPTTVYPTTINPTTSIPTIYPTSTPTTTASTTKLQTSSNYDGMVNLFTTATELYDHEMKDSVKDNDMTYIYILIVCVAFMIILIAGICAYLQKRKKRSNVNMNQENIEISMKTINPTTATNKKSRKRNDVDDIIKCEGEELYNSDNSRNNDTVTNNGKTIDMDNASDSEKLYDGNHNDNNVTTPKSNKTDVGKTNTNGCLQEESDDSENREMYVSSSAVATTGK